MGYWKQEDYIGAGSGATGSLYSFNGEPGLRWTNSRNIQSYIKFWLSVKGGHLPEDDEIPRETEELTLETEEQEFLMLGLRSAAGIKSGEYRKRFSSLEPWRGKLESRLGVDRGTWQWFSRLEGMSKDCLIEPDGDGNRYSFKGKALSFLNTFLRHLT